MTPEPATYPGHRFPAEIISHAVWLYHVFSLSLRDVELILAERGIAVTHESIRQWGLKFGGDFAAKLRQRRPRPGDTWHLDEVLILLAKSPGGLAGHLTAGNRAGVDNPEPHIASKRLSNYSTTTRMAQTALAPG